MNKSDFSFLFKGFKTSLLLFGLLFLFVSTPVSAGTMTGYGVEFGSVSDFANLSNKGKANFVTLTVPSDSKPSNWQSILDTAAANGIKVVIYVGWQSNQICQGSAAWTWNGSDWQLNSLGTQFMDFIAGYIKGGGQGFLALYTVHEPYNWEHSKQCVPQDAPRKLYRMLKREAANRGLTGGQLPLFADIGIVPSDFYPEFCDYCSTWYYVNGECGGGSWSNRLNTCLAKLRTHYQNLMATSPNSALVPKAQSFGMSAPSSSYSGGYQMPTATEMEDLGKTMISDLKANFNGNFVFDWYVWQGIYSHTLKNSPGGDLSYQVMANVYNASGGTGTPPPITPTPTPSGNPADTDGDGDADIDDFKLWINNYSKILTGKTNGDFTNNGKINLLDYGVWLNYYPL